MNVTLSNKPLVEAILEFRWKLKKNERGLLFDPNYDFLIGLLYQRLKEKFAYRKILPIADVPAEIAPHQVQYQFRRTKDGWPLVQLGSGILTVNETQKYSWDNGFRQYCTEAVEDLITVYPDPEKLDPQELRLRYINAIDFDFEKEDVISFLRNKLKLSITLPSKLFITGNVMFNPHALDLLFVLPLQTPKGGVMYKFNRGKANNKDAIILEISIISREEHISDFPKGFATWLNNAHAVAEDSFLTFIEGELRRRFENVP